MEEFALDRLIVSNVTSAGVWVVSGGALSADKEIFANAGEAIVSIRCTTSGKSSVVESSET